MCHLQIRKEMCRGVPGVAHMYPPHCIKRERGDPIKCQKALRYGMYCPSGTWKTQAKHVDKPTCNQCRSMFRQLQQKAKMSNSAKRNGNVQDSGRRRQRAKRSGAEDHWKPSKQQQKEWKNRPGHSKGRKPKKKGSGCVVM